MYIYIFTVNIIIMCTFYVLCSSVVIIHCTYVELLYIAIVAYVSNSDTIPYSVTLKFRTNISDEIFSSAYVTLLKLGFYEPLWLLYS